MLGANFRHELPVTLPHTRGGLVVTLDTATLALGQAPDAGIPDLRKQGTATQLIVDGAPFLIRWRRARELHGELIEPEEGRYEFASVDSLIAAARANDLRMVLLWFGHLLPQLQRVGGPAHPSRAQRVLDTTRAALSLSLIPKDRTSPGSLDLARRTEEC